ncbi:uncharacterized protein EDB91DRAFT_1334731, partial [Suillus paluster]|uniref:uncharacterized protein n=1 Tax=Suillus paluster TaxID=48578 RepID=UPI001B881D9E
MARQAHTMQATSTAPAVSHAEIVQALDMAPEAFQGTQKQKKVLEEVLASLDCSKKFDEQDPAVWRRCVRWAREAMPSLSLRYEAAWPVELYVKISLSKRIAYKRYRFKKVVAQCKHT